jgi:ABC-2 type transport system ATP-binding protein
MSLGIEVRNVRLCYGDVVALDDLTFTLGGGRIYGLLGRNGSGKTSLLSVLAAFRRASAGEALIGGEPVFENGRITRQVCLIRETGDVDKNDKVKDALWLAEGLRESWDAGYAAALLDRFGIPPRRRIGSLSRGQQSALGVTIGLASRAPVTMFDESYLGMDAPSRYAFYDELLADFMAHPRTIVVSTHLIEEVSRLFEEVVIIDRGRLVLQDDTEALRSRGVAVTGPAGAVDQFVSELAWFAKFAVLGEKQLGPTKSATVYGELDGEHRAKARDAGLELGPIGLQDLFVHLTQPTGGKAR